MDSSVGFKHDESYEFQVGVELTENFERIFGWFVRCVVYFVLPVRG